MTENDENRKTYEAEFWDEAVQKPRLRAIGRMHYFGMEVGAVLWRQMLAEMTDLQGKRALLVGCGASSSLAREMASRGADIWCMDISPESLHQFMEYPFGDLKEKFHPVVGDAEDMPFDTDFFDVVVGKAIVHHLDIARFMAELQRVCRPGALIVFTEPLGVNPLINLFRWLTPNARVPTEHPLKGRDLKLIRNCCESLKLHFNFMIALGSIGLFLVGMRRLGKAVFRVGNRLDRLIFTVPPIKWLAWNTTIIGRLKKTHPPVEGP